MLVVVRQVRHVQAIDCWINEHECSYNRYISDVHFVQHALDEQQL